MTPGRGKNKIVAFVCDGRSDMSCRSGRIERSNSHRCILQTQGGYSMVRFTRTLAVLIFACQMILIAAPSRASAQCCGPVTAFIAPQPVVTYYPEVRGLIFPRVVYRPVVSFPVTTAVAPVAAYYVPTPTPVTTFYAPTPVTTFYAPVTTVYFPSARSVSPIQGY